MEDAVIDTVMDNDSGNTKNPPAVVDYVDNMFSHNKKPELLVFGSFTVDEVRRSLKGQPVGNANEFSAKRDLQFGSLDIETVRSLGAPTVADVSDDLKKTVPAVLDKDSQLEFGKRANDIQSVSQGSVKENGNAHTSTDSFILGKGVGKHDANTTSIVSQSEVSPLNQSVDVNSQRIESLRLSDDNISSTVNSSLDEIAVASSGLANSKDDKLKILNGSSSIDLLPRGLINTGNLCFLNATLQALLSCSPFVKLLQGLRSRSIPKLGYPTLHAFVKFISDFDSPNNFNIKKTDSTVLQTGRPLSPTMFEPILKMFTPDVPNSISGRPRQEDAQEFLSFVMDQIHDELLKLQGHSSNLGGANASLVSSSDDDGWETVGPKNKSAVVRRQSLVPSELSAIFGGEVISVVKARGKKPSATVQPFLLLHLDIYPEAVRTIEDALHLLSVPEELEGYRASAAEKGGVVSASKSVQIQKPSKVMILHLMRFGYGSQGSTKLHKPVRFPLQLVLGRELLVSPSSEERRYKLVATVTHHGREPSKGHYTADCFLSNDNCGGGGQWLRYDDASVSLVGVNKVLHDQAYVLLYQQV